ncbi:unnamed protein product [Chilo suppressalis]|uniref:Serine/threonine-protein phosphatase n=1 Tax=Chilo suppressalis TaxID=168631 RepID=A0ABN8B6F2_CHISP|nr:unnamed protein product [Chilo suppressalis]
MFKNYKDICDVVSVLVCCPTEKTFLLSKETSGEFWLPCSKTEKNCWKMTAHKITFELFGVDTGSQCVPLRVYKIWLPNHPQGCVYHAIYKTVIKHETKKRIKIKGIRNRVQWLNSAELERQRAHSMLRSPEVANFVQMATAELTKETESDMDNGTVIEICEENVVVGMEGSGAVSLTLPNCQLLQAANYTKEDQIRMYREFIVMVFPALYMSPHVFSQFMMDLGWQRSQCTSLFRAADVTGRGGLSFAELVLWMAALEPATQHSGVPAEIRCRYIFRYFDSNRDLKLEYVEFKELVAATRAARQLPVDALSVARDADVCLRQLGMQPNTQLPLAEFLRGVGELRLRGTSSLLRSPKSIALYLQDLQERDRELIRQNANTAKVNAQTSTSSANTRVGTVTSSAGAGASGIAAMARRTDYTLAVYTVRLHKRTPNEFLELSHYDDASVSTSSSRLLSSAVASLEALGSSSLPVEALASVHYFAAPMEFTSAARGWGRNTLLTVKSAWSWSNATEESAMGSLLLKLAEAVRPICAAEPRLLRLASPVYAIGDLHGNLGALLTMESALWPSGTALGPARFLFLGDFVDRGPHGAELMAYLLAAKLQRPNAVLMVRGNHETRDIQKMFTFYNECVAKYGETDGPKVWNAINNVFDALPLAAVVDDKVFCCHGGIPPPWVCPLITAIDKVPVPLTRPAEQSSIAWELLWNDPVKPNKLTATLALELASNEGFAANTKRGTGHVFDQSALDRFLAANQLSHVVRAHELHQSGFLCQLRGKLISVFSSYRYCGATNDSGIALLEDNKIRLIRINTDF